MDEFTLYGDDVQEALSNLRKFLKKCFEMDLSLSIEKCDFFMNSGIFVGHFLSKEGIQADPNKIVIIKRVPTLQK